jgi:hypothetical protein
MRPISLVDVMFPRATPLCRFLVAALALAGAARAGAQQLATRSPFMPPQSAAPAGPTASAPLQFIGYMDTAEGRQFRIYDPAKKAGVWLKMNERNNDLDVVVKQHDANTLVVEHQGKAITLAEREGKVVSSGSAAQVMPPPQAVQANVPPAVTQAVVLNPTPADEQRRLEAVAAEVARRRALREQAAQQMNQGTPQQMPPQPAQAQPAPAPQRGVPTQNFRQQQR